MDRIIYDDRNFYFEDALRGRVLIADTKNISENFSRAHMHYQPDETSLNFVMKENFKNVSDYILREKLENSSFYAAAALMTIREFWGKYRPRRILWLGKYSRAAETVAKMIKIFHDDNKIWVVSPEKHEGNFEDNAALIQAEYSDFLMPENFFGAIFTDSDCELNKIIRHVLLSLKPGGLLLSVADNFPLFFPETETFIGDKGHTMISLRVSKNIREMAMNASRQKDLKIKKEKIASMIEEVGGSLPRLLSSGDNAALDRSIAEVSTVEDIILSIYGELMSDDIKYLASRFKESLIEFRLWKNEKQRAKIFGDYGALTREMMESDWIYRSH